MTAAIPDSSAGVTPPEEIARMTTTTARNRWPALPTGAKLIDTIDSATRLVCGKDRPVTDTDVLIWTSARQLISGQFDADSIPVICVDFSSKWDRTLNSDQAREMAAALLESAAEIDGWAAR